MMGDRKLTSAAPPIRGNNQLMVIVGRGGAKRGRGLWGTCGWGPIGGLIDRGLVNLFMFRDFL